ncbi:hypothetical protein [Bradyrhizobium sp. 153]|uniref:hypothetical protein n=1 Tax=Bradyrhizobium sp. 153 TaxID=2782627 RepID=UPI001FF9DC79|nr:hypothetical protein [Bradyrhizobium sp. 153]
MVDLRVTYPLAENAGDILLEHELRMDGDHPVVLSRPGVGGMEPRLAEMDFVHVGRNNWVLDPQQHPKVWTKNENDQWHRVVRPTKYLSKVEDSDVKRAARRIRVTMIPRITWSALFEDWLGDKTIRNDESGLGRTGISLLQGPVQK